MQFTEESFRILIEKKFKIALVEMSPEVKLRILTAGNFCEKLKKFILQFVFLTFF